jgi:hemoglobin
MPNLKNPKREVYIPLPGPPQVAPPSLEIYNLMGEENIFKLLEDFYLELEKSEIRNLFPPDMVKASKKSAAFFVGLFGGPPLYQQKYGPPKLRLRHMHFPINEQARQVWLELFEQTLQNHQKYNFPPQHLEVFITFLKEFSKWMINTKN